MQNGSYYHRNLASDHLKITQKLYSRSNSLKKNFNLHHLVFIPMWKSGTGMILRSYRYALQLQDSWWSLIHQGINKSHCRCYLLNERLTESGIWHCGIYKMKIRPNHYTSIKEFHERIIYLRDYQWALSCRCFLTTLYYLTHDLDCKVTSFWLHLWDNFVIKKIMVINVWKW